MSDHLPVSAEDPIRTPQVPTVSVADLDTGQREPYARHADEELGHWCQGRDPSCQTVAVAYLAQSAIDSYFGSNPAPLISWRDLWYHASIAAGREPWEPPTLLSTLDALASVGAIPRCVSDPHYGQVPPRARDMRIRISAHYQLPLTIEAIRRYLAATGLPILATVLLPRHCTDPRDPSHSDGYWPADTVADTHRGGISHMVAIVDARDPDWLRCANWWGPGMGDRGHYYIPAAWIARPWAMPDLRCIAMHHIPAGVLG